MRRQLAVGRMGLASLALLVVACGEGEPETAEEVEDTTAAVEPAEPEVRAEVAREYAPELEVDLAAMTETRSGLYYETLEEGSGATAAPGQRVTVHYTGWLPSGETFDSSHDRGEPFSFPLGAGRVIPGWDEGVAGMRVGERRLLVIPPDLGYGAEGADGVIPPNATLVFDVELLEVEG